MAPRPAAGGPAQAQGPARQGRVPAVVPGLGLRRYLGVDERIHIADRLLEGTSMRAIAAGLGRSPSTIGREIKRNAEPDGRYRPHAAHARAAARRPRPKPRRLARTRSCAGWSGAGWA